MMDIKETIYYLSPTWLQNVLVSAYGYKLRKQRYGRHSRAYVAELNASEKLSKRKMRSLQDSKFVDMARHALLTVPFYQEWAKNKNICAQDINSLKDLKRFPVITKDMIRCDPERFLSTNYDARRDLFKLNTSGTSGKPLTIYTDIESRTCHYAFFTRLRSWYGVTEQDWRATFFGRIICKPEQASPPFWRYDYFQRNVIFSSYHLSDANLIHYYKKLKELKPAEIIGYPSSIFILATYMKDNRLEALKPKVVFTTAEMLFDHQREIIEKQFECPVIDQYGCTEMAFFASQCKYGSMHLHPEHGYMEIVSKEYALLPSGKVGNALCTGFVNKAMPLIRYEVGDMLAIVDSGCLCGRVFPVITEIEGRVDDILTGSDGRPLLGMGNVFKGFGGIYETQIVQTQEDTLQFNIVRSLEFSANAEKDLLHEIRKRAGEGMIIKFNYVDEIRKNENGKFKMVVRSC